MAKTVIIDAGNISSIDVTAAEYLLRMYESLKSRNIRLFITEHRGWLNEELPPYCIQADMQEGGKGTDVPQLSVKIWEDFRSDPDIHPKDNRKVLALFEWAFGKDAENHLHKLLEEAENDSNK